MNEKSITEIACHLHEPENRIRYLIGKHNIQPTRVVGNCRVYDEQAQIQIKEALFNIRIQRS
jgi:hypothetical protein